MREWLMDYAWAEDSEADKKAVVDCILSQDRAQHVDAVADSFAGASESGGGPEAMSAGREFALSALYETHDAPHLPTCPSNKPASSEDEEYDPTPIHQWQVTEPRYDEPDTRGKHDPTL